jgi:hypothetical protein
MMGHSHDGTDPVEGEEIQRPQGPQESHTLPTRPASYREQTDLQQANAGQEIASTLSAKEEVRSELAGSAWLGMGLVSFFSTLGSEMLAPIRILFLVAVLRMPLYLAGLIEGAAIGASILTRVLPARGRTLAVESGWPSSAMSSLLSPGRYWHS